MLRGFGSDVVLGFLNFINSEGVVKSVGAFNVLGKIANWKDPIKYSVVLASVPSLGKTCSAILTALIVLLVENITVLLVVTLEYGPSISTTLKHILGSFVTLESICHLHLRYDSENC